MSIDASFKLARSAWKQAKNTVLNVPEIERKVKEATSNDKWGPSSTQMREIANATHSYHDLPIVMDTIWKRLNDHGKYWRHVYKTLLLIDYLLHHGADQVIRECRENIVQIQTLTEFQHIDENDKDVGQSVRERAKILVEILHDDKRLRTEREKARQTAKKFLVSMGSDDRGFRGGIEGGGFESEDYKEEHRRSSFHRDNSFDSDRSSSKNSNRFDDNNSDEEPNEDRDNSRNRRQTFSSNSNSVSFSSTLPSSFSARRPRAPSSDGGTNPSRFSISNNSIDASMNSSNSSNTNNNNNNNNTNTNSRNNVSFSSRAVNDGISKATVPQPNIIDFFDSGSSQPTRRTAELDFFNSPVTSPMASTSGNNNGSFGSFSQTSTNSFSSGDFGAFVSNTGGNNGFFDPRTDFSGIQSSSSSSSLPFQQQTLQASKPQMEWIDFQRAPSGNGGNLAFEGEEEEEKKKKKKEPPSPQEQQLKKADPWSQAQHLINLDLSSNKQDSLVPSKAPPMGQAVKSMGGPVKAAISSNPMGTGTGRIATVPITATSGGVVGIPMAMTMGTAPVTAAAATSTSGGTTAGMGMMSIGRSIQPTMINPVLMGQGPGMLMPTTTTMGMSSGISNNMSGAGGGYMSGTSVPFGSAGYYGPSLNVPMMGRGQSMMTPTPTTTSTTTTMMMMGGAVPGTIGLQSGIQQPFFPQQRQ